MVPVALKKYSKFVGTDLSVPCALLCNKHEQVRATIVVFLPEIV